MEPIRVAILEDSAETREALRRIVASSPQLLCVAASGRGEEAVDLFPESRPDVILLDINLPGISGIDTLRRLAPLLPQTQFLMLTVVEDFDAIFRALSAGATGYLLKSTPPAKIVDAIQELHAGTSPISSQIARQLLSAFLDSSAKIPPGPEFRFPERAPKSEDQHQIYYHPDLSERESEVLHWLAKGYLYKEVAAQLSISAATVRTHVQRIYRKLHVRSKTAAAAKIRR